MGACRMMRHSSTHAAPVQPSGEKHAAPRAGSLIGTLAKSRETTLFVVLLLLIVGTALARPQFLNLQNLRDVLLNVSIISLLTAGIRDDEAQARATSSMTIAVAIASAPAPP